MTAIQFMKYYTSNFIEIVPNHTIQIKRLYEPRNYMRKISWVNFFVLVQDVSGSLYSTVPYFNSHFLPGSRSSTSISDVTSLVDGVYNISVGHDDGNSITTRLICFDISSHREERRRWNLGNPSKIFMITSPGWSCVMVNSILKTSSRGLSSVKYLGESTKIIRRFRFAMIIYLTNHGSSTSVLRLTFTWTLFNESYDTKSVNCFGKYLFLNIRWKRGKVGPLGWWSPVFE